MVDEFIARFADDVQIILQELRTVTHETAPQAQEVMAYDMPAFQFNGILVYFNDYARHIGLYPTSSGVSHFKDRLTSYKVSTGAIRFSINRPLPLDLIREIVAFRLQENLARASAKKVQ